MEDPSKKIEEMVRDMKKVMDGEKIPESNQYCQNCAFIKAGSKLLNGKEKIDDKK